MNELLYDSEHGKNYKAIKKAGLMVKDMDARNEKHYEIVYAALGNIYDARGNYRMAMKYYNDALNANLTAFINRLTSIFRVHDFSRKRMYALVVSGYSGGDIVSEQIIGALNFNKGFILPGRFVMNETANDPMSILEISDIDRQAEVFADNIR